MALNHLPSPAGATLVVIGSHAAFHKIESVDGEELQMEPV